MLPLALRGSSANIGTASALAAAAPAAFRARRRSGSSRFIGSLREGLKFVVFIWPVAAVGEDQQADQQAHQQPPRQARAGAEKCQAVASIGKQRLFSFRYGPGAEATGFF